MGIFIWHLDGRIVEANEAFHRIEGYGRDDLSAGQLRWRDLTPAEWRAADNRRVAELEATGTAQPYEKEYFRKDGSRVPVLVGAATFEGMLMRAPPSCRPVVQRGHYPRAMFPRQIGYPLSFRGQVRGT